MESQMPFSFASQWHSSSKLTQNETKWLMKSYEFRKLFFLPGLSQFLSPTPVPKGDTVTSGWSPFHSPVMLKNNSKSSCALSHWFDTHQQGWIKSVVIIVWTKSGGEERRLWRSKIPEYSFATIPSILHGILSLTPRSITEKPKCQQGAVQESYTTPSQLNQSFSLWRKRSMLDYSLPSFLSSQFVLDSAAWVTAKTVIAIGSNKFSRKTWTFK